MAKKKDGTFRMAVDYRDLNQITKKDLHPIPNIQMLLDSMAGTSVYTSLDLFSGYWNVEINEEDKPKTAFLIPGPGGGIW